MAVSARTGEGLDAAAGRARPGRGAAAQPGRRRAGRSAAAHRPRVHDPRRRDRRDRHAVVGVDRAGRRGRASCHRGGGRGSAASRSTTSAVERAVAGQRVAVNLTGVAVDEIDRGDVLASARRGPAADLPDRRRAVVRGTTNPSTAPACRSTTARASRRPGWRGSAAASGSSASSSRSSRCAGDRLVIRQIAPPDTIGGGTVLDAHPAQARPFTRPPGRAGAARARRGAHDGTEPTRMALPQPRRLRTGPAAADRRAPSRSSSGCAKRGSSLRSMPSSTPPTSPRCAPPGRAVRVSKTLHYHPAVLDEVARARDRAGAADTAAR